jgi:hypothetical protein
VFGRKDRAWGCHPVLLQLPAILLHVGVPDSSCPRCRRGMATVRIGRNDVTCCMTHVWRAGHGGPMPDGRQPV